MSRVEELQRFVRGIEYLVAWLHGQQKWFASQSCLTGEQAYIFALGIAEAARYRLEATGYLYASWAPSEDDDPSKHGRGKTAAAAVYELARMIDEIEQRLQKARAGTLKLACDDPRVEAAVELLMRDLRSVVMEGLPHQNLQPI